MKKILISICAVLLVLTTMFTLTACGEKDEDFSGIYQLVKRYETDSVTGVTSETIIRNTTIVIKYNTSELKIEAFLYVNSTDTVKKLSEYTKHTFTKKEDMPKFTKEDGSDYTIYNEYTNLTGNTEAYPNKTNVSKYKKIGTMPTFDQNELIPLYGKYTLTKSQENGSDVAVEDFNKELILGSKITCVLGNYIYLETIGGVNSYYNSTAVNPANQTLNMTISGDKLILYRGTFTDANKPLHYEYTKNR